MAKPIVARIWRGRVPRGKVDEYARYNYEVGIKPLQEMALASSRCARIARARASSSRFHIGRVSPQWRASPAATQMRSITCRAIRSF